MNKLNIRPLNDDDYSMLVTWWDWWPGWAAPPKDFLPDNGKGGFMVEKNNTSICAGFIYQTNSKAVLLEFIISNPNYRDVDRKAALEYLISGCEKICKKAGKKYMFTMGRHKSLINIHKNLGWHVDKRPSHEMVKTI